jgi:hypothetical protein
LLLQWLLILQAASLCIAPLMALLKLILWSTGPTPFVGPDRGTIQSDVLKLGAATANINLTSHSGSSVIKGLQACVQHPFALLAGSNNISRNGNFFFIFTQLYLKFNKFHKFIFLIAIFSHHKLIKEVLASFFHSLP